MTVRQASQGFEQLPMPMSFSGVSQRRLDQLQGDDAPSWIKSRGALAMGAASSAADAAPEDLVAGGNLGAAISYGDITAGGVGTVTSVCEGRLVGFGHPMGYFGKTSLGLMPADAVYVQEDPVGPGFKVANMGLPAGMIDQDRLSGISGPLGEGPEETHVSSYVEYDGRDRDGESFSLVPSYHADVTFSQLLANHDRVIDAWQAGSETSEFSITGTDADGEEFDVSWSDRYVSTYDISYESSYELRGDGLPAQPDEGGRRRRRLGPRRGLRRDRHVAAHQRPAATPGVVGHRRAPAARRHEAGCDRAAAGAPRER